jgi:hypothetical protein
LLLPLLALLACSVMLALLALSVTRESLDDVAGANNLYWQVTERLVWGEGWRTVFLWPGVAAIVPLIERLGRWSALYAPMAVVPMVMVAAVLRATGQPNGVRWAASTAVSAGLVLWLAKSVAFDWSSTDNLTELIAPDGRWGLGGGGYLYALLVLLCANAMTLARGSGIAGAVGGAGLTLIAFPVGWVLLQEGLDPAVAKYGQVFSGAQFLLGPDRSHLLAPVELLLRWVSLQLCMIAVVAVGLRPYVASPGPWRRRGRLPGCGGASLWTR